jgi:hypothetical protein
MSGDADLASIVRRNMLGSTYLQITVASFYHVHLRVRRRDSWTIIRAVCLPTRKVLTNDANAPSPTSTLSFQLSWLSIPGPSHPSNTCIEVKVALSVSHT